MNNPNWPIRVGGEYRKRTADDVLFRVTAIDGDQIFWAHRFEGSLDTFGPLDCDATTFRKISRPEDQSPIPELVAALEGLLALVNFTEARYGVPCDVARAVLAKVKTNDVPDSETVTP